MALSTLSANGEQLCYVAYYMRYYYTFICGKHCLDFFFFFFFIWANIPENGIIKSLLSNLKLTSLVLINLCMCL